MIQFMRGTSTSASSSNQVLQAGQPFYETDTHQLKIGDGSTKYSSLPYIGGSSSSSSSGKKYATVVIGHQDSGLTESDVDYLMAGTSADNEKWRQATGWYDFSGYRYIIILPGTYNISQLGNIYCGNSIIQGCKGTKLTCSNIGAQGQNQLYSNIEFEISSTSATQGFCIYADDITIENCKITTSGCGIYGSSVSGLTIKDCDISGTPINCIRLNKVSNFHIYHNNISTTSIASPADIYFQGVISNGIIESNYMYSDQGHALRSENSSTSFTDVSISNNTLMCWTGSDFIGTWTNVRFCNNTTQCNGGYAIHLPTCTNCSICNNIVPGSSGLGVASQGSGLTECMIANNYFIGSVSLGTCSKCFVTNNYCSSVSISGSGNVNRNNGTS